MEASQDDVNSVQPVSERMETETAAAEERPSEAAEEKPSEAAADDLDDSGTQEDSSPTKVLSRQNGSSGWCGGGGGGVTDGVSG